MQIDYSCSDTLHFLPNKSLLKYKLGQKRARIFSVLIKWREDGVEMSCSKKTSAQRNFLHKNRERLWREGRRPFAILCCKAKSGQRMDPRKWGHPFFTSAVVMELRAEAGVRSNGKCRSEPFSSGPWNNWGVPDTT